MLLAGGILGTAVGVWLFTVAALARPSSISHRAHHTWCCSRPSAADGQRKLRAILREQQGKAGDPAARRRTHLGTWPAAQNAVQAVERSTSPAIPVWIIGFIIGFVGAVMGIGGGFSAGADADLLPARADCDR